MNHIIIYAHFHDVKSLVSKDININNLFMTKKKHQNGTRGQNLKFSEYLS